MTQPREVDVSSDSVVQTLSYASAEHYLEALHPLAGWSPRHSSWIFRGHGDASWRLLPSAHRPNALNDYGGPCDASQVRVREGVLLRQFFKAADRAGLNIPGHDGDSFASAVTWPPQNYNWPHLRAVPLLALAQHHGLPTRLLDWTRSGRIAAYFAAVAALNDTDTGPTLEVWAMRCDVPHYYSNNAERQARVITAPAWSNPHLHAQLGTFTICTGQIVRDDHFVSLDEIVKEEMAKVSTPCRDLPLLKRLQLSRDAAPKLLRLLSYEEVTASTMFPGADGVVKALREQSSWDVPPEEEEF